MSDIVERLRRGHHNADLITVGGVTHDGRCLVAADEILRLCDALAAAQERERKLREALEWYANEVMTYSITQMSEPRSAAHADHGKRARAALGEPQ